MGYPGDFCPRPFMERCPVCLCAVYIEGCFYVEHGDVYNGFKTRCYGSGLSVSEGDLYE